MYLDVTFHYSSLSVSTEVWFQEPSLIPKSADAQVPHIKWFSIMNTVIILYL